MTRRRGRPTRLHRVAISAGALLMLAVPVAAPEAGDGYIGSEACASCHLEIYNDFRQSGHPYKLVPAEEAQVRPIPLPEGYTWDDISYVIGGYKWKARFLGTDGYIITETKDGTPGMNQWNFLTRRWVDYNAGALKPYDCGRCHTTGWDPDGGNQDGLPGIFGTFAFGGVQCEGCHGPAAHFGTEFRPAPGRGEDCGQCHIRGDENTIPASGGFIRHHEQWNEQLAGPHADFNCTNCHDPHKQSASSITTTCSDCHETTAASYMGTPMQQWGVTCEDCHMAKASKSADALGPFQGDVMSHLFTINPDADAQLFTEDGKFVALEGGKAALTTDFACLACHRAEDRAWAELYADDFHGGQDGVVERARPNRPNVRLGIFH